PLVLRYLHRPAEDSNDVSLPDERGGSGCGGRLVHAQLRDQRTPGEAHISADDAERPAGAKHADVEAARGRERDVAGISALIVGAKGATGAIGASSAIGARGAEEVMKYKTLGSLLFVSAVLLVPGLQAQSTEQQIVNDAAAALGGRYRIFAVKTLVVQGGGHDLNVGQSLRYDELGLQSDVWQIREYKRMYDLANGRARFEVVRASHDPYYQGVGADRVVQGLDGDIAFNVAANGNANRVFGGQANARRVEYLRHPLTLVRAALDPSAKLANGRTQGADRLVDVTTGGVTLTLGIN